MAENHAKEQAEIELLRARGHLALLMLNNQLALQNAILAGAMVLCFPVALIIVLVTRG